MENHRLLFTVVLERKRKDGVCDMGRTGKRIS